MKTIQKILLLFIISFFINGNIYAQIEGPGGPFNTFEEVTGYLDTATINNDFIYEVTPNTYNKQVIFPFATKNPDNHKIIFKKKAGTSGEVIITYSPAAGDDNYVVKIDGAHYQFENITFQNTSDVSAGKGRVLTFNQTSNNNDDLRFYNCKFIGLDLSSLSDYVIPYYAVIGYEQEYNISNTHFENDTIIGGSSGIYLSHSGIISNDFKVKNSIIKNFAVSGISLHNIVPDSITNNKISTDIDNDGTPCAGIDISGCNQYFYILSNKIDLSSQSPKTCIKISNNTGDEYIYNNMLTTRSGGNSNTSVGIELVNENLTQILYNSIHIQDGNNQSAALDISEINNASVSSFNNLYINSGTGSALKLNNKYQLENTGNNIYYAESYNNTINENGIPYSLYDWQFSDSQNPFELTSFSALPKFVAPDDLHIYSQEFTPVESRADANWMTEGDHSLDFDGEIRDYNFPDIGADEGMFSLIWVGNIYDNVNWHGSLFVKDTITIAEVTMTKSGNLHILPGTKIQFLNGGKLNVEASINAIGTEDSLIVFTAADTLQAWAGINHGDQDSYYSTYQYCKFEYASADTGGVFYISSNSNIAIQNSIFFNNHANEYGGAIYAENSNPIIYANLFYRNTASEGGAIYNTGNIAGINNNIFYDNSATGDGGAVAVYDALSPIKFYNNTFYQNYAGGSFGNDVYLNNTAVQIYNCIFWNDISNNQLYEINGSSSVTISNCIFKGTYLGDFAQTPIIFNEDPEFTDPANLNFTVQPNSVAINNGSYISGLEYENDYYGNPRIYDYDYGGLVDIGAYELQAPKLVADAGSDISDCSSSQIIFINDPLPYTGTLTSSNPDINIILYGSKASYYITNIPPGTSEFYWTVTDGIVSDTDTFLVTNTQPFVDAGNDIFMINQDVNNDIYPDTMFNANEPLSGQTGYWTQLSGNPVIFSDISMYNPTVSNINYGQHLFRWTISDNGCMNSDSMMLVAGHSFVSAPSDGTLDWNNPADWDVNGVPGSADSVTIYNCTGNVNVGNAQCDRLIVGNGGTLNFEGSAKAPANFSCRTIFIEQNAEKFKDVKGTANIHIGNYAEVNIGSGYLSKSLSTSGSGLFIGGGGTVFIEQNAEKSSKATGGLNIGYGGVIFIEQNAEKGVGNAEFHIGDGGFVFMEQNAEKKKTLTKSAANSDFYIGNGGYVFMEQNAEKGTGGYLHLAAGRTIFIEQNAEKNAASGGHFGIYGGTVFIEQNAEKGIKSYQNPGLYLGHGGTIFIEQNAEKVLSNPTLIAPEIVINGGQIRVGNSVKSKSATGFLQYRQIFIEQNAEKNTLDTAIIVYPSGGFILTDSISALPDWPQVNLGSGNAISFLEGSTVKFENNNFESADLNISEGSSFVDYNQSDIFSGQSSHIFRANTDELYSPFINNLWAADFGTINIFNWTENQFSWNPVPQSDILTSGKGYYFQANNTDTLITFWNNINQGDITVPVTADNPDIFDMQGWNLLGNPYPSYIDLETISLPSEINNTFYFINSEGKISGIYQQGGISLNDADAFVAPSETFLIKTDANSTFTFDNNARVHLPQSGTTKDASNFLKLKIQNNDFSDEIALAFNTNASDDFDSQYDAVKFISPSDMNPVFCSSLSDNTKLAINTVSDFTDVKTIPVSFKAFNEGTFSINLTESNFTDDISVTLKDLKNNATQDLISNPVYNFTYQNGDDENRFEIILGKASNIENIKTGKTNIFAEGNNVFVNTDNDNSVVEVYNINGQIIFQKNINKGLNSFTLNVPSAIYFVKVSSEECITNKKVFIYK